MNVTKLNAIWAGIVAGVVLLVLLERSASDRLREENRELRGERLEPGAGGPADAAAAEPIVRAAAGGVSPEGPAFSGELELLRRENLQLGRLVASQAAALSNAAAAAGFEPSAGWVDAGNASPEAAATTFAWAIAAGDEQRLLEVGIFADREGGSGNGRHVVEVLGPLFSQVDASRLIFSDTTAPGEVTLWFQSRLKDGNTLVSPLTVKQLGGEWKVKLTADGM